MSRDREQQLVDITFSCVLTMFDDKYRDTFIAMTQEQLAAWVAKQLDGCGFYTQPVGSSWGVLMPKPPEKKSGVRIVEPERDD